MLEKLLIKRGIDKNEIDGFFEVNTTDISLPFEIWPQPDYWSLGIAIQQCKRVIIPVHNDVDSMCSSALLIDFVNFNYLVKEIVPFIHNGKGDGLRLLLENFTFSVDDVILCPDAGSSDYFLWPQFAPARLFIFDHHELTNEAIHHLKTPDEWTEYECQGNVVIENPKIPKEETGHHWKMTDICATTVVWQYLRTCEYDYTYRFIDLVALATVTDMMPIKEKENRALIQTGLKEINNQFIQHLLDDMTFSIKGKITQKTLGWNIGPLLNALCRVGTIEEREIVLKALTNTYCYGSIENGKRGFSGTLTTYFEEGARIAKNAYSRQNRRVKKLTEKIEDYISEQCLFDNNVIIVPIDEMEEEDFVLSGLIANKILEQYSKPIFILYPNNGKYCGSLRSKIDFRDIVNQSGLARAMGHNKAAGVEIEFEDLDSFLDYCNQLDIDNIPTQQPDFVFMSDSAELSDTIFELEPVLSFFMNDLPEPLLAVIDIEVNQYNTKILGQSGKRVLKIKLPCDVELIKFGSSDEEYDSLTANDGCVIKVIGTPGINEWMGKETAQIIIKEIIY